MNARQLAIATLLMLAPPSAGQEAGQPPVERPTTVIPREGCVTAECHPGIKQFRHLHGPANANACDSCHTLTDAATHTFADARARDETCSLCHVVDTPAGARVHEPVAKGECLSCHDPHGSAEKAMLRGERYADACKTCHEDVTGAHDRVHGPASAGACGACHEPHAARLPRLLIEDGRDLCLRCHVATALQIESRSVVHKPVLGDCQVCHDPHATDHPGMISADPVALCTGCHQDIAATLHDAPTQHGAVTTERSCLNCHTPHAGDRANLLRNDEMTLCFECHDEPIKLDDGTRLPNMKKVIETRKSLHGAIAERSCAVCHEIHGGGHRRLLTNEYPPGAYYPFSESAYALCFSCHDRQLVLQARTEGATSFRNGDRNLHYVHVNRENKSRSCRVCHDAHAANHENHIRSNVPFGPGGWRLPINYEPLPEGGRCGAGCHNALEYNRTNPIAYPADTGEGAWKGLDLVPGIRAEPPKDKPDRPE